MRRQTRRLLILAALVLSIGGVAGGWYGKGLVHSQEPADSATAATAGSQAATTGPVVDALAAAGLVRGGVVDATAVRTLVDALPADTHARTPNYDRAAYGPSWADTDHNECDQRNDVLARDLTAVTYTKSDPGCTVATGHLADVYTGRSIDFTRGKATSAAVQIDHLVPLGWAWQHGAAAWAGERREQLATDLNNLRPSTAPPTRPSPTRAPRPGSRRPPATTACT